MFLPFSLFTTTTTTIIVYKYLFIAYLYYLTELYTSLVSFTLHFIAPLPSIPTTHYYLYIYILYI